MKATPEMVRSVFAKVLEKQVFLFAEELEVSEIPDGGEWVEASMSFHGPFGGGLSWWSCCHCRICLRHSAWGRWAKSGAPSPM